MDKSRWAEVGDLIIQTEQDLRHHGVVHKIIFDKYHHGKVFVKWITTPQEYNKEYGISQSNIHNRRGRFDLVKARK